jgi:predicted XRE-type DNA-binding protein
MIQTKVLKVTQGSKNVFEDLGFEPEEALNLKIRADLMLNIRRFIKSQGWTQKKAALFFGETQPRISDLMNGDIERFSIDKLVQMLSRAGMNVRVEVDKKAAWCSVGFLSVIALSTPSLSQRDRSRKSINIKRSQLKKWAIAVAADAFVADSNQSMV